jgi:hypothetical protein
MTKKPMTNPKYQNVGKVLDTGKTINDVKLQTDKFVTKRKGELFKRLKPSTLVKLIDKNPNTESIYNLADECEMLNNLNMNNYDNDAKSNAGGTSVYSVKTSNTQQTTTKTVVTAITYVTEMLGNLVIFT